MRRVIGWSWIVVWLGCLTVSATQLPPDVLVDKYLLQAKLLSEEKNYKGALEAMDRIVSLQKEHRLTLSADFPFHYAQTALAAGSVQAGIDSVNRYLSAAAREGKYYREALELLVKAERTLGEPAPDTVAPTPGKPDREPLPQEAPTPPRAQQTTTARPVVDCSKWNTKKFFRKATVEEVTACLAAGSDPMARGKSKHTPLHYAAMYNENPAVIEALLKAGADLNARNKWESTPLHLAVMTNKNPTIIKALLNAGADANARNRYGHAPLHTAVGRAIEPMKKDTVERRSEIIGILIDAGGDLNARTKSKRFTPLHYAAWLRVDRMVQTLVDAGADLTALDKNNKTPRDVGGRKEKKILDDAWRKLPESQKMAHRARVRRKRAASGPSFLDVVVGVAGGAAIAAAGEGSEEAVEAGTVFSESVISGTQPAAGSGGSSVPSTESSAATAGSGACQVPGYPNPPGGVANLGFSWCPASVGMQVRAFALQAAGAQCAMATGSSSTPEQIEARRREIRAACDRLAALGQGNCQCPPDLRQ